MKVSIVFLALVAFAAASTIPHWTKPKVVKDRQFLERQKQVLELYNHVTQHSHMTEHVQIAKTWEMEEHLDHFKHPEVVEQWLEYWNHDPLKRGEIFSIYHEKHLQQAIALFRVLYYAKDWETFYKTAVWARQHVNEPLFVYSFSVAVLHRPDTEDIMLPPIHEVYPYYFFPTETIYRAQYHKQVHDEDELVVKDKEYHGYTINSNYSGHYLNLHPEQALSYFTEDIGLNSANYYYHLHFPGWMSTEEYGSKLQWRGVSGFYRIHHYLNRYYLERLSNDFGDVPWLDWEEPIETPYTPSLVYANGLEFPSRPRFANLHDYFYHYGQNNVFNKYKIGIQHLKDYERRLMDVVDSGIVVDEDGEFMKLHHDLQSLNILGNLAQGNNDSLNRHYYGNVEWQTRHLLGYAPQPINQHQLTPSALEHHATVLRDPIAYQVMKRWESVRKAYLKKFTPYTQKDLKFPGVQITDVEVDEELITYPEYYYSDISNAVFYGPRETREDFRIRVRQQRLNHKPFDVKLHVKSDKNQKVTVKVFFGPKYDEYGRPIDITTNHWNFITFDQFSWDLKAGNNVIERDCHDFNRFQPDRVPGWQLYKQVEEALEQKQDFEVHEWQNWYYIPQRMMLPKGSEEGTPFQFFFFVYPYQEHKTYEKDEHHVDWPTWIYPDHHACSYPLERFVQHPQVFDVPNAHFEEVKVFHHHHHDQQHQRHAEI